MSFSRVVPVGFQRLYRRFELQPASFGRSFGRQDGNGRPWHWGWGAQHYAHQLVRDSRDDFPLRQDMTVQG